MCIIICEEGKTFIFWEQKEIWQLVQEMTYIQKAGDAGDISPPIFLDFPPNFRLSTRNPSS